MFAHKRFVYAILSAALVVGLAACGAPAAAGGGGLPGAAQLQANLVAATEARSLTGIVVTGTGTASAQPELALIHLGVETVSGEAGAAIDENTAASTATLAAIKGLGVDDKDVQTVSYNVWVEQVTDKEGRPTGELRYHATNQLRVRLRDPKLAGKLLGAALKAGANTVNGVSFTVSDMAALERQARDLALADAKAKAEQIATGLGAKVGKLRYASDSVYGPVPGPMPMGMGGIGGRRRRAGAHLGGRVLGERAGPGDL
ncbi:MAG: SIMPL domain-containing protein [Chloroflexota bacterium]